MSEYIHPISAKEFRMKMPFIWKQVQKGQSFMVIHQSTPIAKLIPVDLDKDLQILPEATDQEVQDAAMYDLSQQLDDMSDEEYEYYENLTRQNGN